MIGRYLVPAALVALALAALVAVGRPYLLPTRPTAELLAVLVPDAVRGGERFVVFAGVRSEGPTRLLVRVCATPRRCQVERSEPFSAGTVFKWVAGANLIPGGYAVEAYLQVPTPLGYRSVDRFVGRVAAR